MNQKPGFSDNLAVSPTNFAKNPVSRPPNGESETGFFRQSCAFTQKLRKKPGFWATQRRIRNRVFSTILRFHPQTSQKTRFLGHPTMNQKPGFFHNLALSPTNFAKNPVSGPPTASTAVSSSLLIKFCYHKLSKQLVKKVKFMAQTIQARNVALNDLETQFKIEWIEDDQFFREWQDNLPEITDSEKQRLDRVKASYRNLLKHPPLLENTVKMVVLSPLLDLADFYLAPFHVTSERSVEIIDEDEGLIVRGQMDVLALFQEFWVVVIESKKAAFSLEVGIPQLLAYMLGSVTGDRPTYGLLMNGADFLFVKLVKGETPQYAFSRKFYLFNPGNDLYTVLSILKRLGELNVGNVS